MMTFRFLLFASVSSALPSSTGVKIPSPSFIREAEIKHGRVAMTSAAVLSALSLTGFEHPATVLSECSSSDQLTFFSSIGILESIFYLPRLDYRFSLKKGAEPGQIFDIDPPNETNVLLEDVWGRIAMLGVASFILEDSMQSYILSGINP